MREIDIGEQFNVVMETIDPTKQNVSNWLKEGEEMRALTSDPFEPGRRSYLNDRYVVQRRRGQVLRGDGQTVLFETNASSCHILLTVGGNGGMMQHDNAGHSWFIEALGGYKDEIVREGNGVTLVGGLNKEDDIDRKIYEKIRGELSQASIAVRPMLVGQGVELSAEWDKGEHKQHGMIYIPRQLSLLDKETVLIVTGSFRDSSLVGVQLMNFLIDRR